MVKSERQLMAKTIHSDGRAIQLVAQMRGWQWGHASAVVRVQPLEIIVRREGATQRISVIDPVRNEVGVLIQAGLVVSACSLVVMFVARWVARQR